MTNTVRVEYTDQSYDYFEVDEESLESFYIHDGYVWLTSTLALRDTDKIKSIHLTSNEDGESDPPEDDSPVEVTRQGITFNVSSPWPENWTINPTNTAMTFSTEAREFTPDEEALAKAAEKIQEILNELKLNVQVVTNLDNKNTPIELKYPEKFTYGE